jgi:hypothetical protein
MADFEHRSDYLLMCADDAYSLESYKQAVSQASAICLNNGITKILADIRGLRSRLSALDRFELGVHIAKTLGMGIEIAIVAPAKAIDKLAEDTAVNRGGRLLVTEDVNEALRWLRVRST